MTALGGVAGLTDSPVLVLVPAVFPSSFHVPWVSPGVRPSGSTPPCELTSGDLANRPLSCSCSLSLAERFYSFKNCYCFL